MRILIVTDVFPPAIGGPATFGARLAQVLHNRGYSVRVVCSSESRAVQFFFNFPVIRAGIRGNVVRRELDRRQQILRSTLWADIVFCMGLEHQTHWACRISRSDYVLRIGGDSVWEAARNLGLTAEEPEGFYSNAAAKDRKKVRANEIRRQAQLREAKAVIYVSEYLKRLAQLWTRNRPLREEVIYNGISKGSVITCPTQTDEDLSRLLFVGRQTNWKGVDALLLALTRINGPTLTIAGSGPEWPANVDLARRLGLAGRVDFCGDVDYVRMEELMRRHDILILPSLYEGMSNTLLEAGAAGLACIASDRGGNPELIHDGRTGLLADPFDVDAFARAIRRLVESKSERRELAQAHQERVLGMFSLDRAVDETIRVLKQAAVG